MKKKGFVISAIRNKRNHWLEAEGKEEPTRKVFLYCESFNSRTSYQIEQQAFNFLEMPREAWTSSCTGKCSQTQCALGRDEQVETERLTKCRRKDKDDSVPSGLTF